MDILQYESKIWATADLLRGSGIKESEWPSFMMPFFALTMIESRLVRMLELLLSFLKDSATYKKFYEIFIAIYNDKEKRDDPESYLDFTSSLEKYIEANPKHTADDKAKAAQYFTILNRIEYVIEVDPKFSEPQFIQEFESKIETLFKFVRNAPEGARLIVKINSHVSEEEIYSDFAKLYRRFKALNRQTVGEYFFKEMDDLVEKLCDDFEGCVRSSET